MVWADFLSRKPIESTRNVGWIYTDIQLVHESRSYSAVFRRRHVTEFHVNCPPYMNEGTLRNAPQILCWLGKVHHTGDQSLGTFL